MLLVIFLFSERIFPTQESDQCHLHCRQILLLYVSHSRLSVNISSSFMGVACHVIYRILCPVVEFEPHNCSNCVLLIALFSTESERRYSVTQ